MTVFARICFEVNCCNCIIIFALALNLVKHCSACGNTFTSAFAEIIYDGVYTSGRYDGCVNDHRIERFILHTPTKQILKGTFLNLHKLFEIGFNDCGVSVIEPGFAENLTTIRIFKAERDYLQVIEHNVFNTLPLELIDVSANRISYIEDYAFEGMDLKYLCLSGNKLSSINSTWFRNTKILALAITHNEIRSLDDDTFSGLIELVTLKLNFNKIISISPNAFLNIKCCLTKVYLPGNSIVYLDFKTPNELVEMDVGFNQISSIPLEDTTTLRKISIHPNPWSCGCLTQFKKECEKKNIEIKDTYALKEPTTGVNPICVALNITCTNIRVDAQKLRDIYFSLIDYNAFGNIWAQQKIRNASDKTSQEIIMKISYRGLKLVNPLLKESICEHEVQNIHSACQDPECRLYFAYITKDANDYYYHIFSRNTAERATDIILTLDQPFELTYQVALKEQVTSKSKPNKDTYKCALSPPSDSYHSRHVKDSSVSKKDLRLNGHPLR